MTRSSTKSKTSLAIAANLSELELKKILIEKMESNNDKLILALHGGLYVSFKGRRGSPSYVDEDKAKNPPLESTGVPKDDELEKEPGVTSLKGNKTSKTTGQELLKNNLMKRHLSILNWFQKPAKIPTPDRDWNKTLPAVHGPVQPWLSNLAQEEGNHGSKLDWHNPEGQQYPHDLRKPLPLIPNSRGRQVIPFDHFINNDLAYLSGGVSSRTYATSVTKTKAADYGGRKGGEEGMNYARDVYSKRRIIVVIKLQIVEWHSYKHLDWIIVRRDDDKLYIFKEGDFKRLRLQDIEDMLILLVQGKLTNLNVEDRLAFGVSLRMFTRSIVIQRRVEDLQLGVKSYQKKLNITKPNTYRSDLKHRDAYTAYSNPIGFIYQNKEKKNKLMRIDELHKFSDGTLADVRTTLNDRLKWIRMEYLPKTIMEKE
ncbi:hypothetical protein Tco_1155212 [Tanacetum coccineum]